MSGNNLAVRPGAPLAAFGLTMGWALALVGVAWAAQEEQGRRLLAAAGVQGGLIVHVGCGDGQLTAALRAHSGCLVHGLDRDPAIIERARKAIQSRGLYGAVSIDRFDGKHLPYVDGLVRLLIVSPPYVLDKEEMERVLAPGGAAVILKSDASGEVADRWVKPRPAQLDEWSHFLHDATNNAVAADSVVGPPRRLQWVGGPAWTRSHDHLASLSVAVSAGGRLFSIIDEGPIAFVALEPKWNLVACDAFSGVELWRRPIAKWQWHLRGFRSGPSDLARRLVATENRVFVTLASDAPVSALDAATGQTLLEYPGTEHALEIVHHQGTLLVVAGDRPPEEAKGPRPGQRPGFVQVRSQRPPYAEQPPVKRLVALEAATGRLLWKKADADTAELMPTTLAAKADRVFFQNAEAVFCLDARQGTVVWRAPRPVARNRPAWSAPTLVVYEDVVLSADRAVGPPPEAKTSAGTLPSGWFVTSGGGQAPVGELIAFSAADGKRLWSAPCRECYNAPVDVLVADGLVWTGDLVSARDPGITAGRDPRTGEIRRTRPADQQFFDPGMGHQRCYRNKATSRWLVLGRSGIELIDLATGNALPHHWVRGTCQYGVLPCNGLLYVPPHSCACFITAKLNGYVCLSPQPAGPPEALAPPKPAAARAAQEVAQGAARPHATDPERLERGPAYRAAERSQPDPGDWPTYRHDAARTGRASCPVPAELKPAWRTPLGGRLSAPVVAQGKVLVAQIDQHTVHALDAATGRPVWSFTAGGRVDSPPTVWEGRALFGSADGWVYCLRLSDGALAWRWRAAPLDRRIVAYGQIESSWPVPGNVLVHQGIAYFAAGRSSYLDGGIRLCRLEAATGRLLSETVLDHRDPQTGVQRNDAIQGTNMPGALPDVLSCDGQSVYLRHVRFDLQGREQAPDIPHLFSPAGFLDDTWWHRTYWLVGRMMGTNYGGWPVVGSRVPAGRLLVLDDSTVYGFGRNQYSHTGSHVAIDAETVFHFNLQRYNPRVTYYQAFAMVHDPSAEPKVGPAAKPRAKRAGKPATKPPAPGGAKAKAAGREAAVPGAAAPPKGKAKPGTAGQAKPKAKPAAEGPPPKSYRWTRPLPVLARAMLLAGQRLFLAGPPDIFQAEDPLAAIEGRSPGRLLVLAATDGNTLAEYRLESPPVFDGLAAAQGALYLADTRGDVWCFRPSAQ